MSNNNNTLRKKAELIINNRIYVPKKIKLPFPMDRSTAGPSTGSFSIAMIFSNKNIKLIVSRYQNEYFSLHQENGKYSVLKNGEIFIENVGIIPILFHSPQQAFINLDDRCIYNCAFCNISNQGFFRNYSYEKFINLILKVSNHKNISSIALTSGIYPNNNEIIKKMCYIIKNVREKFPNIPIGVEPYISNKQELFLLKKAGANEIKINLQIPDRELFGKLCPNFNYEDLFKILEESVKIFRTGKVTSNIIYGLGESDRSVINAIERLAKIGVVPTLRKIRINEGNRDKLEDIISNKLPNVSVNRIIRIAQKHKKILVRNNLTTKTFETMCHKCGCCDIVPFWDI